MQSQDLNAVKPGHGGVKTIHGGGEASDTEYTSRRGGCTYVAKMEPLTDCVAGHGHDLHPPRPRRQMRGESSDKPKQLYFTIADICFGGFVDGGSQLRRRYSGQDVTGVGGKADHGGGENLTRRR
jgi:hypothetical protein